MFQHPAPALQLDDTACHTQRLGSLTCARLHWLRSGSPAVDNAAKGRNTDQPSDNWTGQLNAGPCQECCDTLHFIDLVFVSVQTSYNYCKIMTLFVQAFVDAFSARYYLIAVIQSSRNLNPWVAAAGGHQLCSLLVSIFYKLQPFSLRSMLLWCIHYV